jgi:hypothetical protein
MKKLILMLGVVLITSCAFAVTPPTAVQKAFAQKFAKATDIKWGKENSNEYEAEFVLEGIKMSANFATDGTWLETETTIPVSQLPAAVTAAVAKLYPNSTVIEADKIERAGKATLYETEIKTGTKKKEVVFDDKGVIQK